METTRTEHLAWCKQRALAELDHQVEATGINNAWKSMTSDLLKHPDTINSAVGLGMMLVTSGQISNKEEMAKFINDFN